MINLTIKNLSHRIKKKIIFENLNLDLNPGFHALLGDTGSGKSLLLSMLATYLMPDKGIILIDGTPIYENKILLSSILYLTPDYITGFKRFEQITLIYEDLVKRMPLFDIDKAYDYLREFELSPDKTFDNLSLGQKSLVIAIIGLASNHQVLMLDSIYHGMDYHIRKLFNQLLLNEQQNKDQLTIVTTELKDEIMPYVTSILTIENHQVSTMTYTGEEV